MSRAIKVILTKLTVKIATVITGGLGRNSKMPGRTYGISALLCKTGSKLRKVKNSVCEKCYAMRGCYRFKSVALAHARRYASLYAPRWVECMVFLIAKSTIPFFRFHDSGDIQSLRHLKRCVAVAALLPKMNFWMPTKEYKIVRAFFAAGNVLPINFSLRVSAPMINGSAPNINGCPTSVVRDARLGDAEYSSDAVYTCPASNQEDECKDCRACWDYENFPVIEYPINDPALKRAKKKEALLSIGNAA